LKRGARDLKALLTAARFSAPYVLVGHSKGGLHVRTYARLFPDDVVSMLLMDAAEEEDLFSNLRGGRYDSRTGDMREVETASLVVLVNRAY
jgi:pimeloyl-ACP methyl ester carboxylesterase